MKKTRKKYNKFLIISTIFILLGGSYSYFSNDLNSQNTPIAFGSSLTSSTGDTVTPSSTLGGKISSDISFLTTLVSLKKINIDTTLFTNKAFNALQDNIVKVEPIGAGRINPFAPVDTVNTSPTQNSQVVTNTPTEITEKSASLNGVMNVTAGVTDTFFQYGPTEALGVVTASVKQSLVGTFIKNVSGLNPKTAYFYKACAKINNTTLCGDTVSFTTN